MDWAKIIPNKNKPANKAILPLNFSLLSIQILPVALLNRAKQEYLFSKPKSFFYMIEIIQNNKIHNMSKMGFWG
jgi:hypothetical protein